ncbi:hypothetical protein ACFVH6_28380 [Spirillospora sp. NPDC127200]
MNRNRFGTVLTILSFVFGGLIALLAVLDVDVSVLAVAGGVLLALAWSAYGLLGRGGTAA